MDITNQVKNKCVVHDLAYKLFSPSLQQFHPVDSILARQALLRLRQLHELLILLEDDLFDCLPPFRLKQLADLPAVKQGVEFSPYGEIDGGRFILDRPYLARENVFLKEMFDISA